MPQITFWTCLNSIELHVAEKNIWANSLEEIWITSLSQQAYFQDALSAEKMPMKQKGVSYHQQTSAVWGEKRIDPWRTWTWSGAMEAGWLFSVLLQDEESCRLCSTARGVAMPYSPLEALKSGITAAEAWRTSREEAFFKDVIMVMAVAP